MQKELSMSMHYHFMVDFTMPGKPCDEFFDLIPYQRVVVNKYFQEGKLLNYALSEEKSKLWAVFNANSEMEVLEMLVDFPLTRFMQVEICLLSQFDGNTLEPTFSLN